MTITDQKNFAAGLLYTVLGGIVAGMSITYHIGTLGRMGPGFFPLCVGLALVLTGIVVLVGAIGRGAETVRIGRLRLDVVLFILGAVVAFAFLIRPMGLAVSVTALVGISALADRRRSWRLAALAAAILVPLSWLIFVLGLGLNLRFLPTFLTAS